MPRYGREYGYRDPRGGGGRYDRSDYGGGFPRRGRAPEGPPGPPARGFGMPPRPRGYDGQVRRAPERMEKSVRAMDIMTPNPEAVTPDTSLAEVARCMRDLDVGIIPVVDDLDGLRLRGVITDRDIVVRAAAEAADMESARVREHMTARVDTVSERADIREVFAVMKRDRVRRVPVVDDEGRLVGIIAQADLAVQYAGLNREREAEVEEVLERISEPAEPNWRRGSRGARGVPSGRGLGRVTGHEGGFDLPEIGDRVRQGWSMLKREARHFIERGHGYDRGWR